MKPGELTYCGWFKNQNGHLALKTLGMMKKFCGHCGEKIPSDKTKLGRHIKRQCKHNMTNFLACGHLSANSKFENFKEFMCDSSIFLYL